MSIKIQQVNIKTIPSGLESAIDDRSLLSCSFCGKGTTMSTVCRALCEKLSRPEKSFCRFCLRNGLTSRNNRHTLILTFRSVFGYLYYSGYKGKKRTIYHSELRDLISSHEQAGLFNPVFKYDPESFLWFVDFERVGSTGRKVPVEDVLKTIVNILACFNFPTAIPNFRMYKFFEKYEEAIRTFYEHRSRPEGKRILCPTVQGCGPTDTKELPLEKTREFSPQDMVP